MRSLRSVLLALGLLTLWPSVSSAQLGTLGHDGPATPEQISMYLPVTGTLSATQGVVRYRPTGSATWEIAHPIYRIRPAYTGIAVPDAFAGVITGLTPGTEYTVEVTIDVNGTSASRTLTATTRALPSPSGTPNKTIAAGSTEAQIQAVFDGLVPGDVVQLANGTYSTNNLHLDRSGTDSQPIVIRGASRSGVVIRDPTGIVMRIWNASNVILEDLTLEGSMVDSGTNASAEGIRFWDGWSHRRLTARRLTVRGVDKGVASEHALEQILIYDCSFTGNNAWAQNFLETNMSWNDDGIRIPGAGNVAFNNTMAGFGDVFAVVDGVTNVGIHFYRNDVRFTCDDAFEGDYGHRNLTFYDNRIQNSMTLTSFDPLHGGPAYVFRNISINTGRSPFKFNSRNSGHFIYNNTIVRTFGAPGAQYEWAWVQFNNGDQRAWAYRNNVLIGHAQHKLLAMEASGQNPIDFTNNAWFPSGPIWWSTSGGNGNTPAEAYANLPATQPVFSASTRRHESDRVTQQSPFVVPITLGANYLTQITASYTPTPAPGTALKGGGAAIPGITDGHSGSAPDMGAVIAGRPVPIYGDRSGLAGDAVPPNTTSDLTPR
ncbi:MAG TPA: hypothetical protein VFP58_12475 [Candidatus Eisenbacteria bacterium]|nr:hypothetical protein [Candidatus Eisenbacteria bacterium]